MYVIIYLSSLNNIDNFY